MKNRLPLCLVSLIVLGAGSALAKDSAFEPMPRVQEMANAYGLDLIDYAKKQFKIDLDWSEQSIKTVDGMCDTLHREYQRSHPTEEQLASIYKMVGSYVGEVLRRNHGGEWGVVIMNGERFFGMRRDGNNFWPWGKAKNRIINGDEDNLWPYYLYLAGKLQSQPLK